MRGIDDATDAHTHTRTHTHTMLSFWLTSLLLCLCLSCRWGRKNYVLLHVHCVCLRVEAFSHQLAVDFWLYVQRAYIKVTLGAVEGFFGYYCCQQIWMKPGIQAWDHISHTHKTIGEISPGVPANAAKKCFVFFSVTNTTRLSTLILHWFRPCLKQQMLISVLEHTPLRNFRISA